MNEFIDYAYGWLDKVLSVTENGKPIASFNYHNDGQIAQAIHNGQSEDFLWDGLALIHRGETSFINEPYVIGGNPVMAGDDVLFNDMLGSTLAVNDKAVEMTSFGETGDKNAFFTGKPMIDELGYSFLFRDYNPNQGKWTTTDPFGYPDGWNNLAYVNNGVTIAIDWLGANLYELYDKNAIQNRGHILPFATWQNADGRWYAKGYDYGAKSSSSTGLVVYSASGNSEMDVIRSIIRQSDSSGTRFEEMSKWIISNSQSIVANEKMVSEVQLDYHEKNHNCLTISKEARKASDIVIDEGKEWLPVYAMPWRTNRNNAGSILTLIQQQIKE